MTEPVRTCEWLFWCRGVDLSPWEISNEAGTDSDVIQVCGGHAHLAVRSGYRPVEATASS